MTSIESHLCGDMAGLLDAAKHNKSGTCSSHRHNNGGLWSNTSVEKRLLFAGWDLQACPK